MNLYPFVGMDDSGDMHIYMSPFRLHKLSPMHSRGKPFPDGVDRAIEPEHTRDLLKKLCDYFNDYDSRKKKK
jgi:hypothetical protein